MGKHSKNEEAPPPPPPPEPDCERGGWVDDESKYKSIQGSGFKDQPGYTL